MMQKKKAYLVWAILAVVCCVAPLSAQESERPWWHDRVFYQIFVRSFYDSDGDGVGDFRGILEKLDYLNDGDPSTTDDLGVTGLWLMPIFPSPTYHGYDVTDYYTVNPDYGTAEDFQALLTAAHARGIAVILDLVINHTADDHPWFIASRNRSGPYDEWYIWADEDPGYVGPWGAVAWHRGGDRYYYGVFESGMPDLNYNNPEVIDEMFNIAEYWLADVGVDGFRIDAAKHIVENGQIQENTPESRRILALLNTFSKRVNPDAFIVGELFNVPSFRVVPYLKEGAIDVAFDFALAEALLASVLSGNKRSLARQHDILLENYPQGQYAAFLTNHDQPRVATLLRGDDAANKVAATLLLTERGVPFLYYGEEIGMFGAKPDPRIRTPMQWTADETTAGFTSAPRPWEPLQEGVATRNVATQTDDPDSLLSHYRALIHLRNRYAALRTGDMSPVESSARQVYAFLRHDQTETLLVLVNLDDEAVDAYTLSMEGGPLSADASAALLLGTGEVASPAVTAEGGFADYTPIAPLPPHSSFIIRLGAG